MKIFWIILLSCSCFGLNLASTLPSFSSNMVNSTAATLRNLGCDVDLKFQEEGMKVKLLCELEDVMTWLDTWLKPLLVTMIIVAVLIGILVALCFVKLSNWKFGCCCKPTNVLKRKRRKDFEDLDTRKRIPLVLKGKEDLKHNSSRF